MLSLFCDYLFAKVHIFSDNPLVFITIFDAKLEDTCTLSEKYSSKLDISRSFIRIFEVTSKILSLALKKYSSKLDISRSFIRIFAIIICIKA